MSLKVTKTSKGSGATGDPNEIDPEDKLAVIKEHFKIAKEHKPNYTAMRMEMKTYDVEIPDSIDREDISKAQGLYAIIQSHATRVATIESIAVNNHTLWARVVNLLEGYILDRECQLLVLPEVQELSNSASQKAYVHNKLVTFHDKLRKVKDLQLEAESFYKEVLIKKKDLEKVMTNLNRQVKARQSEQIHY